MSIWRQRNVQNGKLIKGKLENKFSLWRRNQETRRREIGVMNKVWRIQKGSRNEN